jgi:hypothetical protein
MKGLPFCCPAAPAWHVDWPALTEKFEWIRAMRDCPQDEVFHAEGTVWTHVGMVCEALAGLDEFRALPELDRHIPSDQQARRSAHGFSDQPDSSLRSAHPAREG